MSIKKNHIPKVSVHPPDFESGTSQPFVSHGVKAGFPSPALDFMEYKIDLNKVVSDRNPLATFYIKVDGNSMTGAGIDDGDILVTDRSLEPADGKIAVCLIDGEFTVKRLKIDTDCLYLMPENPDYPPVKVTEDNQFVVWGIVTYIIKKVG
ncbi:LexA family protein [Flavobacterium sp. AG291]|uniref:LexA family protein n=1 Tax=Flavobacterium sp. AG291 TaxID=2184000 RepID=UPI000E0B5E2A|nr:translesion error-prone DNA polymerase V autoproteolytic subunit [Flavobacterium sp. AG291]RDI10301.1 DNA polymerase V [Flavobacterium sp. AG291]